MNRKRDATRLVVLFVAVAVASGAVGVLGTLAIKSPAQLAAETAPPPSTVLTARVTSGRITDTLVLNGKVSLGNSIPISPSPPLNGEDEVITKINVPIGGQFRAGSAVLELADRPLIVLASPVPLLRDISLGSEGPDVDRFQQALRAIGLKVTDKPGRFGTSTAAAVRKLYEANGYVVIGAGNQVTVSRAEVALIPMNGVGEVTALSGPVGSQVTGAPITVTTTPPQISATTDPADAARLSKGMPVALQRDGAITQGLVALVGNPSQQTGGGFEVSIGITSTAPIDPSSIGASVEVTTNLNKDSSSGLKVPLAAVYSGAGGQSSITVVNHGKPHNVSITVLQTGDGFAQFTVVSGAVSPGALVRVGATR